jgi:alginate O-acetyltransferase complex protein AlgI
LALATFLVVSLTWIPFRAPDLQVATHLFAGLARSGSDSVLYAPEVFLVIAVMLCTFYWQLILRDSSLEQVFARLWNPARAAMLAGCLVALYLVSGGSGRAFIYYQF